MQDGVKFLTRIIERTIFVLTQIYDINKNYLLLFLLAGSMLSTGNASGQAKTYETTFGGAENDLGNFVQQTLDGAIYYAALKATREQ